MAAGRLDAYFEQGLSPWDLSAGVLVAAEAGARLEGLRGRPADVGVSSHARLWGRYRKFVARDTAKNPADPFIDPEGYRAYVDSGEARFRRGVVQ